MSPLALLLHILTAITAAQINKKFVSNSASKSLLCNSCAMMAEYLNHTLFNNDGEYETNVGFRLDSNGKKIRKNSQWLRLHIKLEDINCNWRDGIFPILAHIHQLSFYLSVYFQMYSKSGNANLVNYI